MTAHQLNTAWMLSVLQQAIANTAAGAPIFVGDHPEINALRDAGFLKIDKRKKGDEAGTYWAQATDTANEANFNAAFLAPAAPTALTDPNTTPATLEDTATPQFEQAAHAAPAPPPLAPAPLAAPVSTDQAESTVIGANSNPQIVDTVVIGDTSVAIQTGIAYVKHKPKPPTRDPNTVRAEKYPFSVLANMKRDNMHSATPDDNFVPSFHVAGAVTKNFSGNVTRANETYEASHGVTFRSTNAAADDVNGAGVRVFCMSIAQAPARATRKAKNTEVAQTPVA